jgi:hypothetical protein
VYKAQWATRPIWADYYILTHRALQPRIKALPTLVDKIKVCVPFVVRLIETKFDVNTF